MRAMFSFCNQVCLLLAAAWGVQGTLEPKASGVAFQSCAGSQDSCTETVGSSALLQVKSSMKKKEVQDSKPQLASNGPLILTLDGFQNTWLNDIYTTGPVTVNGMPTYVSEHGYAIYWCQNWHYWAVNWFTTPLSPTDSTIVGCYAWAIWYTHPPVNSYPPGSASWEWINGGWVDASSAGVVDVSRPCSSYQTDTECDTAAEGCQWQGSRCTAKYTVFGPNGPLYDDVDQGDLGTCYFLAALVAVAYQQPQVLEDMYVDMGSSYPVHVLKFLLGGKPRLVAVDEYFPVTAENMPAFVKYNPRKLVVWPMLFEKAWAKIFGSFKGVEFGYGHEGFKALAQAPMEFVSHGSDSNTLNHLWNSLLGGVSNSYPMYAGTTDQAPALGLAASHAYAVLGAELMMVNGAMERTVKLYNPWGTSYYSGAMPNNATEVADGLFSMLLSEYAVAFSQTDIAEVKPGYSVSYQTLTTGASSIAVSVEFAVQSSQSFDVQLEWPSARLSQRGGCDMPSPRVNLNIFKDGISVINASQTQARMWQQITTVRASVAAGVGSYTAHVYVDFPNATWVDEVVLNTYAAEPISISSPVNLTGLPLGYVELEGFRRRDLNGRYEERTGEEWKLNGRETYWSTTGYFLYYCPAYGYWSIGSGGLDLLRDGSCYMWGHGPWESDILQVDKPKGWYEWTGRSWAGPRGHAGVAASTHANSTFTSSLLQGNATLRSSRVERCRDVLDRLDHLNNVDDILVNSSDRLFPPAMESIARAGETCGDSAQNIANSCAGYNHWSLLADILADVQR